MNYSDFVHLRVHTEFSLIDGLVRIESLVQVLPQLGMHAVGVTDFFNLFSSV